MKRTPMTFTASHEMASADDGTMPGVSANDYAAHVLARTEVFAETIVEGAIVHLDGAGVAPIKPESWGERRWQALLFELGVET